ncbi:MAG: ectoine hydroxylase [Acidimicrobiales bacterium]|nr:ectoine hydroxylase [Acidimicrobiales bacterium]
MSAATDERIDAYPSRLGGPATITERHDPVVHGSGDGPLDADVVQSYADDGFIVLEGLLAPSEAAELNAEIDRLAADPAVRGRPEAIVEPDSDTLRSLFAVHDLEGPLGAIARDPRLVGVARQLLGSDVYVHQSRVNLKPAFRGKDFYWHSDFETWHTEDGMPSMRAVSCSVLLTDNTSWNGPLLTIAGSHRWYVSCEGETPANHHEQSLRRQEVGTPDDASLAELYRRGRIAQCLGPAGTVVFFECNIMHGSNSNITPLPRRNVFQVYNSVENALEQPFAAPAPRPHYIANRRFDPI